MYLNKKERPGWVWRRGPPEAEVPEYPGRRALPASSCTSMGDDVELGVESSTHSPCHGETPTQRLILLQGTERTCYKKLRAKPVARHRTSVHSSPCEVNDLPPQAGNRMRVLPRSREGEEALPMTVVCDSVSLALLSMTRSSISLRTHPLTSR